MITWILFIIVLPAVGFVVWAKWVAFEPQNIEPIQVVSKGEAPMLEKGQKLKILSWNIQFLAGRGKIFFWEVQGNKGPDERPSRDEIERTLPEVVRILRAENPDVILLQEVDDGATRTYGQDQLKRILELLPQEYTQHAEAFYWKMAYVPHPRIRGSVGTKLSVISRIQMRSARRFSLPQAPLPGWTRIFQFRRAMLEVHFPVRDAQDLVVMNSHLEPFIQDGSVKKQEIDFLKNHFLGLDSTPWIFGADMNMLPPGFFDQLPAHEQIWYQPEVDVGPLYDMFPTLPTLGGLTGSDFLLNRSHYPNRPLATGLDKTIDFIFHSPLLQVDSFHIRQNDCLHISDHMPLIARFTLPTT